MSAQLQPITQHKGHRQQPNVERISVEHPSFDVRPRLALVADPPERIDRQRPAKSVAGERVESLVDAGTFLETLAGAQSAAMTSGRENRAVPGDGVITGTARIDDRPVCVVAQDPRVLGGSVGRTHAAKIAGVMRLAERIRCPVVSMLDSGGARIQEGVGGLDGYGAIFRANVQLSGRVPQISVVLGACAGGAVYSPGLTDIVIATENARLFLTGPRVVKAAIGEDISAADLGGAAMHHRTSGVVHLLARDGEHANELCREVLSYLPSSCDLPPPVIPSAAALPMPLVPENQRHIYDVRTVIGAVVDGGVFCELQGKFASNIVIGFGRVEGSPVGVIANQPQWRCGVIDIAASEKAARFVRLCDAFGLPLVTLVDTPGFLPGSDQEHSGIIRKGAKLLYAYAEATVPRITVILRKAFGGAHIVMNCKSLGADAVFAWPTAQAAVMGAPGAVEILFRRELEEDPASREELLARYEDEFMRPRVALAAGTIDQIIAPHETRAAIAVTLQALQGARRTGFRHDNLPQ
jgi:acetyl-CoA carboxylase carboxyltransferase component